MSQTFHDAHYIIISRRSAHKRDEVELLLRGWPEFRVIVDRRVGERRKGAVILDSDHRSGLDRRS